MPHDHATRRHGVLTDWNDDRGFGFIEPSDGGRRLFAHISAFPNGRRPTRGCRVSYTEVHDERRRPQASEVGYLDKAWFSSNRSTGTDRAVILDVLFLAALLGLVTFDRLPVPGLIAYIVLSAVAFAFYRADKTAAGRGHWRTPESTLHLIAVVGGWPGALLGRHVFRHKTRKQPFRTIFWITVALNCAALGWYLAAMPTWLAIDSLTR